MFPPAVRQLHKRMLRKPGGNRKIVDISALVLQPDEQAVLTALELALVEGFVTKTHVPNLPRTGLSMARPSAGRPSIPHRPWICAASPRRISGAMTAYGLTSSEAPRVPAVEPHRRRVCFFSTIELVNAPEQEKDDEKAAQIAKSWTRFDLMLLDELGCLPFRASAAAVRQKKVNTHTSTTE